MPTKLYSTQFLNGFDPAGGTHSYTVPAGYVAVVRSIDLWVGATGATALCNAGSARILSLTGPATVPAAGVNAPWQGRQVVPAGGEIQVSLSTEGSYAVSGYLLTV